MQKKRAILRHSFFPLLLFVVGGVVFVAMSHASDSITDLSKDDQKHANDLQDQLDSINAKIKAYKEIIDLKARQGVTLSDQMEGLQAQIDTLQLEIDKTTAQISELEGQINSLSLRIGEKSIVIDQQKRILSELMRVYYDDYSGDRLTMFLSSADSLLSFKEEGFAANVSDRMSEVLDSVKTLRDSLSQEQQSLTQKKKIVDALYQDLAARNKDLVDARQQKAALLSKTQADQQKYSGLVDDLQKQREAIENEIEDLESGMSTAGMPDYQHGLLSYPVKNVTITQGYGKTSFSKTAYKSGKHNGIDFGGSYGSAILAADAGKVIGTGNLGRYAYGKWVAIDHGNGMVTLYGHMSSISVSKGDKVDRGKQIGKMGNTGYATGTHLHLGVYSSKSFELVESSTIKGLMIPIGATVDPRVYLPN